MTALFAAGTAAIFAGPLAVDALWRAGGTGDGVALRVIPSEPDAGVGFGQSRVVVRTMMLRCPVAMAPTLARGDSVQIGAAVYAVTGAPRADTRRLWWTCEAQAQPEEAP